MAADLAGSTLLESIDALDMTALYTLWRTHDKQAWQQSREGYIKLATRLLRSGEPLLAFDVISEALSIWIGDPALMVLEALALARCGASERANAILRGLYDAGHRDQETVSILARTHKDLWLIALDVEAKRRHLTAAEQLYTQAFDENRAERYWSGINAAALALLLGKTTEARARAHAVMEICRQLSGPDIDARADRYWRYASMGEAALILEELPEASKWYRAAASETGVSYGDVASTRRNARLILGWQGQDDAFLDRCLPAPRVIVFSGHMVDGEASPRLRFAADWEPEVKRAVKRYLERTNARIGFASAACGSDIIFLETMLELGGEINVVLPSDPDSFGKSSVEGCSGTGWLDRFHRILDAAKQVILASEHSEGDVFLAYANILLYGLAKSRARQVDGALCALTIWDGAAGRTGGTAQAIDLWRDCGQQVHAIHPLTLVESELTPRIGAMQPSDKWLRSSATDSHNPRALVSMLFADAVGFSKLTEQQIPIYVTHFLGRIADLLAHADRPPVVRNTWGDGLYLVFDNIGAAGRLALDLCDLVTSCNWYELGLPAEFNIRIGLHSGPAYPITDPITHQFSYTGVHVSRAARIEPITPPGAVYASQPFAALAEAVGITDFACDYVGQAALAKNYGQYPTFRIRRR
jgi:class 3 adenylate cyclase